MGKPKLTPATLARIRKMFAEGLSNREIATTVKVARSTVSTVVEGCTRPKEKKRPHIQHVWEQTNTQKRCPNCGVVVNWPCYVCILRGRVDDE